MAPEDWRMFAALLAEAFPQARYMMRPTRDSCNREGDLVRTGPPRVLISHDFMRIQQASLRWQAGPFHMIFDPDWMPVWYRNRHNSKSPEYWSYHWPWHPSVDIRPQKRPWIMYRGDMPGFAMADISVRCQPDNREHYRLAGRIFRLLAKVASNRNLEEVSYPGGQVLHRYTDKGDSYWVGYEARRWALRDPSHFIHLTTWTARGLRPMADAKLKPPPAMPALRTRAQEQMMAMPHWQCRHLFMLAEDMQSWGDALADAFPGIRYVMHERLDGCARLAVPPHLLLGRSLPRIRKASGRMGRRLEMVLDPDWQPVWQHSRYTGKHRFWTLRPPDLPRVEFYNSGDRTIYDRSAEARPYRRMNMLAVRYAPDDAGQREIVERFFATLSRVASNRDLVELDLASRTETRRFVADEPAWGWIGHAARAWALEPPSPTRVFGKGLVALQPVAASGSEDVDDGNRL